MIANPPIETKALPIFNKEKDILCKKYRYLSGDFNTVLSVIIESPSANRISIAVSDLSKKVTLPVFKVKKFKSKDFPNKGLDSGFRIIYMYDPGNLSLYFIEIYHKNHKSEMDRERVKKLFDNDGNLI